MTELSIQVTLPDNLKEEAEANGLLSSTAIENLLREEIRRRRTSRLFEAADRLAMLELPPLTDEEIAAEIQAVRQARRSSQAA